MGSDVVVRVVAGVCAGVGAAPPLNHGVTLLDVSMRPGETVQLPVDLTQGVLLYVLEGVALFGAYDLCLPPHGPSLLLPLPECDSSPSDTARRSTQRALHPHALSVRMQTTIQEAGV